MFKVARHASSSSENDWRLFTESPACVARMVSSSKSLWESGSSTPSLYTLSTPKVSRSLLTGRSSISSALPLSLNRG